MQWLKEGLGDDGDSGDDAGDDDGAGDGEVEWV